MLEPIHLVGPQHVLNVQAFTTLQVVVLYAQRVQQEQQVVMERRLVLNAILDIIHPQLEHGALHAMNFNTLDMEQQHVQTAQLVLLVLTHLPLVQHALLVHIRIHLELGVHIALLTHTQMQVLQLVQIVQLEQLRLHGALQHAHNALQVHMHQLPVLRVHLVLLDTFHLLVHLRVLHVAWVTSQQ